MPRIGYIYTGIVIVFILLTGCHAITPSKNNLDVNNYQEKTLLKGADISHYQGEINWQEVKKNNHFVFIKATEGISYIDKNFKINSKNAIASNLFAGPYHFYHPDKSSFLQASHFIETVQGKDFNLPPVLDIELLENQSVEALKEEILNWTSFVYEKFNCHPIIYTNHNLWQKIFANGINQQLWLSEYDVSLEKIQSVPWIFWQYTQNGKTSGINKTVDLSFYKNNIPLAQLNTCNYN